MNIEDYILPDAEEMQKNLDAVLVMQGQILNAYREYCSLFYEYKEELSFSYDPTDKNEELDFCMQLSALGDYEKELQELAQTLYYLSFSYARLWQQMIGKKYCNSKAEHKEFTDEEMDALLEQL